MHSEKTHYCLQKAAQFGGISLLALVFVAASNPSAGAQDRFFGRDSFSAHSSQQRIQPRRAEPRGRAAAKQAAARKQAAKQPEKTKPAPPPAGPHLLVISVKSQKVSFYANGNLVSQSPVSTGKVTHPTPHGVFSIIQRNRHHRSNIYSGAPMPYMQRLTWSGVALHQGALPGHPASHGCVRLPEAYADYLWRTIKMNTRVIVARDDTAPVTVAHALLFQPKPAAATVESSPELRKTFDTTEPARVRTVGIAGTFTDGASASVESETAAPMVLAEAMTDPAKQPAMRDLTGSVDPLSAVKGKPETGPTLAGEAPKPASPAAEPDAAKADTTASAYPQSDIPNSILSSFAQSLEAKHKKAPPSGNITVFISKKEKRLYVRQHFIPLFSAPVTFKDDKPNFGTHVFTALEKDGSDKEVRWIAVTLPAELPKGEKVKTRIEFDRRGRPIEVPVPVKAAGKAPEPMSSLSATAALDRIEIAQDVRDRISEYVTAGASLIVSDHGLGTETGLYTDFIVVTR